MITSKNYVFIKFLKKKAPKIDGGFVSTSEKVFDTELDMAIKFDPNINDVEPELYYFVSKKSFTPQFKDDIYILTRDSILVTESDINIEKIMSQFEIDEKGGK